MHARRLAWWASGLALAALLTEALLRLSCPDVGSLYQSVVTTPTRFKMRPSSRVVVPERYGTVAYTFNREGYRDGEHTASAASRIVVLGDSVTFGLGVAQEQIYTAQLRRLLAARFPARYDVANLAIFAYDTANELDTLREDGLQLRPRIVVVQFFMNDFATPGPGEVAPPPTVTERLEAARNLIAYRSQLVLRLQQLFERAGYLLFHDARRRWMPDSLNSYEPVSKLAYLRQHPHDDSVPAFNKLEAISEVARHSGARLLVLVTPDEFQLYHEGYDGIDRRIAAFARSHGIPLLDLLPAMRRARGPSLFLDGVHLTEAGHRMVAEALATEIERLDVRPPPQLNYVAREARSVAH